MPVALNKQRCFYWILGLVVGPALAWAGGRAALLELELRESGTLIRAFVLESRVSQGKYRTEYDLRYMFMLSDSGEKFTRRDLTLFWRTNLWSPVHPSVWHQVLAQGRIDVVYLADDPHVNRPDVAQSLNGPVGLAIVGAVAALACFIGLVREVRRAVGEDEKLHIDFQVNFHPRRQFLMACFIGLVAGWLGYLALIDALADNGSIRIKSFVLHGTAATFARWAVAGFFIVYTIWQVLRCASILFRRRGQIAMSPRGLFFPSEVDGSIRFVKFEDIADWTIDIRDERGPDDPEPGLYFSCAEGEFTVPAAAFSIDDFEEMCYLFMERWERTEAEFHSNLVRPR